MATDTVKDYLGYPCKITDAFERYEEPVKASRSLEQRDLIRQIGELISEVDMRDDRLSSALEAIEDSLPNDTDSDKPRALLTMAREYDVDTSNKRYQLMGRILVALEVGGLVGANQNG